MAKTFSIALIKPNMAKWKMNLIDGILSSIPVLAFKRANGLIDKYGKYLDHDFINAVADDIGITTTPYGVDNIPATGPVTIASNHPGGPDVLAAALAIAQKRKDFVILANELICIPPIENLVIPVNTLAKKKVDLTAIHDAYKAGKVVVFFAAGKNSRYNDEGLLRDRKWRTTYLDFAQQYKTPINIMKIEGKNSPLFYKVSNFRSRFKQLKNVPLENMFQLRELTQSSHVKVFFSKVIKYQPESELTRAQKRSKADSMYNFLYTMDENNLDFKNDTL